MSRNSTIHILQDTPPPPTVPGGSMGSMPMMHEGGGVWASAAFPEGEHDDVFVFDGAGRLFTHLAWPGRGDRARRRSE